MSMCCPKRDTQVSLSQANMKRESCSSQEPREEARELPKAKREDHDIVFNDTLGEIYKKYESQGKIAATKSCTLFRCVDRTTGTKACVKVRMRSKKQSEDSALNWEWKGLSSCLHPNLLQALELIEEDHGTYSALVTELMDCDLFALGLSDVDLPVECIRHISLEIAKGIHYLHYNKGMCHMDIKPENVLVKFPGGLNKHGRRYCLEDIADPLEVHKFQFKIADMGFWAKCVTSEGKTRWLRGVCGSRGYTAPEVTTPGYDGAKADMWSLARTIFVLAVRFPPWEKAVDKDPYFNVWKRGMLQTYWQAIRKHCHHWDIPDSFVHLISHMLHFDPDTRLSCMEVVDHPFFKGDGSFHFAPTNEFWNE